MKINLNLVIDIDDNKTLTLTEEEARVLYDKLKGLFDTNNVTYIPYQNPYIPPAQQPWITWTDDNTGDFPPNPLTITTSPNPSVDGDTGGNAEVYVKNGQLIVNY